MKNPTDIAKQYKNTAQAMRDEGWNFNDNSDSEELYIENANFPDDYYVFRYNERDVILKSKPEWLTIDIEDYILASAANW